MSQLEINPNHLIIGLGGTGGLVLKAFKKRLYREFPDDAERYAMKPAVEFLYVDSTRDDLMNDARKDLSWRVVGRDVTFTEQEFLNIKSDGANITQILDNISNYPGLKYIVRNSEAMKQTIGTIDKAAGQKRRAGRIMFASSCGKYLEALAAQRQALCKRTSLDSLHIHFFTGLAGGTGSGSIIDAVAQARKAYPDATIDVYAMIPEAEIPSGLDAGRYHQNGYAALMELNALNVGRFLPCDVITGEEHISLQPSKKQFGLVLYSNVNNNGVIVDSRSVLPELVADALFLRIFLPSTEDTNDFFRTWSCENIDDHIVENSEKSKGNDLVPARTKAVASFGIKRICYPEEMIQEHISYSLAEKIVCQMQYNNFKEEGDGFIGEPVKKDYSEYTKDESKLIAWKLDEAHLFLEETILPTDKKVDKFKAFWDEQSQFFSYDDAKSNSSEPLMELEQHCKDVFDKNFRLKQGVHDYYSDKSQERPLREQTSHIIGQIEQDLYSMWLNGHYSLYDLTNICDVILDYIKKCINNNDKLQEECRKKIADFDLELDGNSEDFNKIGLIQKLAGKSEKCFSNHQAILSDLYLQKTREEALSFRVALLVKLKTEFEDLASQINDFVGKLSKSQDQLAKAVSARTKTNKTQDGGIKTDEANVEIFEGDKMTRFEEKISRNRTQMDMLAGIVRKALVNDRTFAHFGDIAKTITETTMTEIADKCLVDQIVAIHSADDSCRNDKILGINVLQLLHKQYNAGDLGDLDIFAKKVVSSSGVFLKLSGQELNKKLQNNPDPLANSHSILRKSILISLPKADADDSLKAFAVKLKQSLQAAFPAASIVKFFDASPRKNEISIMEVNSCFPIRCLDVLPLLKGKYVSMVNNENEAEKIQARILLHSEGDGSELPHLEGESVNVTGDDGIVYMLMAAAADIIQYTQDDNEYDGWCYVSTDDFGATSKKLLSRQFTDILTSDKLSQEDKMEIFEKVDEYYQNAGTKKSDKEALANKVADVMKDYVVKECSSASSPVYLKYKNAAKEAMSKITK